MGQHELLHGLDLYFVFVAGTRKSIIPHVFETVHEVEPVEEFFFQKQNPGLQCASVHNGLVIVEHVG